MLYLPVLPQLLLSDTELHLPKALVVLTLVQLRKVILSISDNKSECPKSLEQYIAIAHAALAAFTACREVVRPLALACAYITFYVEPRRQPVPRACK